MNILRGERNQSLCLIMSLLYNCLSMLLPLVCYSG
jgi:hypothetical protein